MKNLGAVLVTAALVLAGGLLALAAHAGSTAGAPSSQGRDSSSPSAPAVTLTGSSGSTLSIAWTASVDDTRVVGYGVFRDGSRVGTVDVNGSGKRVSLSYFFTGLACGRSHSLGVEAYDRAGNVSPRSTLLASTSPCTAALPPPPSPPASPPPTTSMKVGTVGDIHPCSASSNSAATANVAATADFILGLGDYQYDTGTLSCYNAYFDKDWGKNVPKMYPVLAPNHDQYWRDADPLRYWNGAGASGYKAPVTLKPHQSYSFDRGGWHFIAIDDSCYRDTAQCSTSALLSWVTADLAAASSAKCTIAYWHQAYWTSPTSVHSRFTSIKPVVQALYNGGVDIVLQAHNHDYERFALQTPDDQPDSVRGIRAFVVGTGGMGFYSFGGTAANSVVRQNNTYGVLMLTLGSGTYSWQFVRAAGGTFADSGSGSCH